MQTNFHNRNRQKLLLMVRRLHQRGYGKLRVIPSVAPNGLAWRCVFTDLDKEHEFIASTWIRRCEAGDSRNEIKLSPSELADNFIKENSEFIEQCKGRNEEYEKWFSKMLDCLTDDELPYAFDPSDLFYPTGYWLTTKNQRIKTLTNEKEY